MKKMFFYTALVLSLLSSCQKEDIRSIEEQPVLSSKTAAPQAANVEHIKESATSPIAFSVWNPCTEEFVDLSGTLHYILRWTINNNKETFMLHFNASNVKGVGRTSGTQYVTTSTFNYSNTNHFSGDQRVFQQSASTRYVALGGEGSFTVINDWHLTVNANGEETRFFTTGGEVSSCK